MDIYKLTRRFCSIFGNYEQEKMKLLYRRSYEAAKACQSGMNDSNILDKSQKMFENVLSTSILTATKQKVTVIIKHSSENTFSAGDLSKFIDRLKVEGHTVKMVFLDYVDVMTCTINKYIQAKDYDTQGQIVQELRNLSRQHKIPIITATQNNKMSENYQVELNNTLVGDKYNVPSHRNVCR